MRACLHAMRSGSACCNTGGCVASARVACARAHRGAQAVVERVPAVLQPLRQQQRAPPRGLAAPQRGHQLVQLPVVEAAGGRVARRRQLHGCRRIRQAQQLLRQRRVTAAATAAAAAGGRAAAAAAAAGGGAAAAAAAAGALGGGGAHAAWHLAVAAGLWLLLLLWQRPGWVHDDWQAAGQRQARLRVSRRQRPAQRVVLVRPCGVGAARTTHARRRPSWPSSCIWQPRAAWPGGRSAPCQPHARPPLHAGQQTPATHRAPGPPSRAAGPRIRWPARPRVRWRRRRGAQAPRADDTPLPTPTAAARRSGGAAPQCARSCCRWRRRPRARLAAAASCCACGVRRTSWQL